MAINPTIVYVVSEYPAISHTFISREVDALRHEGYKIFTASVRRPEKLAIMSDAERAEAERTFYIKDQGLLGAVAAHLRLVVRSPRRYFAMVMDAARCWRKVPIRTFTAIGYVAEAGILADWMVRNGFRHVHVHFANPAATVAMLAASTGWFTYSLSVHGPDDFYNVDKNLLEEKFARAQFIRCISHFCLSQVWRLLPPELWQKCAVIRCGIDPRQFTLCDSRRVTPPEVLCVGRLTPAKGQAVLLEACWQLRQQGLDIHVVFVGEGPDRTTLEHLVAQYHLHDRVRFVGAVGQHEIQQYYERATLFVLPSFAEGLPVVLMEAMAKGVPCVSTTIAGIPELIHHGENGLLVSPADPNGLAAAIRRLLEDSVLRDNLARAGRKTVEQEYDLHLNCARMARLFEQHLLEHA